ncbi:cdc42-interacting protein 4 homolog isoform X1 [Glossina fuscipes]|uniref:Cdc42-interacting protein 4 homolog isoform X1 n=1 Tax=Glossina fuscipes TaxID=7396 RepID=A0A8U0W6I1_9MUSC|nr:cdc42-interacting protein 4 homolog isoform X1 [Glossina fuscipes]XP_037880764.1 cdc42-interacting protein 4 homolog isoform X1 [Glossina fuscipes]XP_037880765.1 cdc42-interacting protein 4 homolog isoform X1 [Glossina fuscipes]
MSWGTELWDQYDNLAIHTSKGIEFLDKYANFIRDRLAIETEYAAKLRRLAKNYQPKKKEEDDNEFTSHQAFRNVLKEINDLAGQREVVAESLQLQIIQGITLLSKTLREERKKCLSNGTYLQQNLSSQLSALERAKRNYEKAYRDSEKAVDNYKKADMDLNLSRAEVERYKNIMTAKIQQSDDAKNEYANQLQKTNNLQQQHYNELLPEVFNRLQELDEKRTRGIREFIIGAADVESSVAPIIARCLEGMVKAGESINEKEDSYKVIERYQSGFTPPTDIPFEDLSKQDPESSQESHYNNVQSSHLTVKGTISANRIKKRVGIFNIFGSNKQQKIIEACITLKNSLTADGQKEDFSDLPPNQRRKKLQAKIAELQQKIAQETAARDGLMKMKVVYEANSSLGNPMTVEGQLNESEHKLEKLKIDLKKYQGYLERANQIPMASNSPQANRNNLHNGHRVSRHSNGSTEDNNEDGDDQPDDGGSLSRSDSEDNVAQIQNGHNNNNNGVSLSKTHLNNSSSASPESGLGTSHTSLPGSGQGSAHDNAMGEDAYYETEMELLQPLGTCRALYPFEATSEGSIPMNEGEVLQVIEIDQGDGWTRVRRLNNTNGWDEGFVPTSYIECTLYA